MDVSDVSRNQGSDFRRTQEAPSKILRPSSWSPFLGTSHLGGRNTLSSISHNIGWGTFGDPSDIRENRDIIGGLEARKNHT